ncbi:hypothetical protein IJJ27_02815 [bacterium]|nr:hypothetical protein [bacterium]MBQ6436468.1 hypothetical protein [bacterium]
MARTTIIKRYVLKFNAGLLTRIKRSALCLGGEELGFLAVNSQMSVALCRRRLKDWWQYSQLVFVGDHETRIVLDPEQFLPMWDLTVGRRLQKVRYSLSLVSGEMLDIDVFKGSLSGKALASVTCRDRKRAAKIELPDILGVVCDVSSSKLYREQSLAVHGWPKE